MRQQLPGGDQFTCPRCARTSAHPTDAREGYCGACHEWTGPRFGVIAEHNHHGGWGWTVFDRQAKAATGGWFADRVAAERTADVLNSEPPGIESYPPLPDPLPPPPAPPPTPPPAPPPRADRDPLAERDAIANRRVRLQRVFQTRLGMPDRIDVLDPGGKLLASITATEGAIALVAADGRRLESSRAGLVVNLDVRFVGPEG